MARTPTPGIYQDGVLVRPLRKAEADEEPAPAIDPRPRCPKCWTWLQQRKGKHGPFWGCGNFPHCKFTASTGVVDEAIRRQLNSGR